MEYISKQTAELEIMKYMDRLPSLLGVKGTKILCPFHGDKKPSMQLYKNEKSAYFFCFGCRRRFSVPEVYYKLKTGNEAQTPEQIIEAYNMLLKDLNLNVQIGSLSSDVYEFSLKSMNKEIYNRLLTRQLSNTTFEFLKSKGFTASDIPYKYFISDVVKFDYNKIIDELAGKYKVQVDDVKKTIVPLRQGRIVYAILNESSNIIAYVSRSVNGSEPKYINSGTTPIYSKSNYLYGMHIASAQPHATNAKELVIVEGYNDAIAMWEHNYLNCVALGGTALTNHMVDHIKRWGYKEVTLMLDNDKAGLSSMLKALVVLAKHKIKVNMRILEAGKDIDEMFMQYGSKAYSRTRLVNPYELLYKMDKINELASLLAYYQLDTAEIILSETSIPNDVKYQILYAIAKKKLNDLQISVSGFLDSAKEAFEHV